MLSLSLTPYPCVSLRQQAGWATPVLPNGLLIKYAVAVGRSAQRVRQNGRTFFTGSGNLWTAIRICRWAASCRSCGSGLWRHDERVAIRPESPFQPLGPSGTHHLFPCPPLLQGFLNASRVFSMEITFDLRRWLPPPAHPPQPSRLPSSNPTSIDPHLVDYLLLFV